MTRAEVSVATQRRVLHALQRAYEIEGVPPTVRELAAIVSMSQAGTAYALKALHARRLVRVSAYRHGCYVPTGFEVVRVGQQPSGGMCDECVKVDAVSAN